MFSIKGLSGSRLYFARVVLVLGCLMIGGIGCQQKVVVELPSPPRAAGSVGDQLAEIEHCFALIRLAEREDKLCMMADEFERIDIACDLLRGKARFSGPNHEAFGPMTDSEFAALQANVAVVEDNADQCRMLAMKQYEISLRKRWALLQKAYGNLSAQLLAMGEQKKAWF